MHFKVLHIGYDTRPTRTDLMKALIEFLPLAAFLAAYYFRDIYFATATLMVAMPLMLLALWLLTRRVPAMPLISTLLVLGFGALTLLLRDPDFIIWKPTIFLWGVALVLLVTGFTAREPLIRRFLAALAEGRRVTAAQWRALNWCWVACYALLGLANLLVARLVSQAAWVNFKVFGLTAALMVFLVAQTIWLQRRPSLDGAEAS
jgi:intracellular septation protein